jgi:biopolymer transport protein ExbD
MAVKINHGKAMGMLSLTSLMDVVFLLLIFFLVATKFAEEDEASLDVQLPSASEALPLTDRPKAITVSVDQTGRYLVGGVQMNLAEVEEALRKALIDNPLGQTAVIRGDKRVSFEHIVSLFDLCHKVGIPFTITTDPTPGTTPPVP